MEAHQDRGLFPVALRTMRDLVSEAHDHFPVDLCKIVEHLGFTIEEAHIQAAGFIPEAEDVIVVRRTDLPTRKRFTIAHEIGHIVWRRLCQDHGLRETVFRKNPDTAEERVADRLATELLMPEDVFQAQFGTQKEPFFPAVYSLTKDL